MEVFGIGPLEFLFIFIIILLVIGPKDIEKTARNLGKGLNRIYRSPNYQVIRKASEEIRNLPARLAAEAQLDELKEMAEFKDLEKDLNAAVKDINTAAADPMKAWVEETKKADNEAKAPPAPAVASPSKPAKPAVADPLKAWVEETKQSNGEAPALPDLENSIAPPSAGQAEHTATTATTVTAGAPVAAPASPTSANESKS